jgi:hypothetical protein
LGIGTNAPTRQIEAFASNPEIATRIATNGTAKFSFLLSTGTELAAVSLIGSTGEMRFRAGSGGYFQTFYSQDVEAMRIDLNQNINIGATALGARLGIKGSGSTSATTSLLVQNSGGVSSLQVTDDGSVTNRGKSGIASNVAFGIVALNDNVTGYSNTAIGTNALQNNTSHSNTAIGQQALQTNTTGSLNSALGVGTSSGNFSGSTILGYGATATANNQFVVGSTGTNAGAVNSTSDVPATFLWSVRINGTNYKILMTT